MNEFSVSKVKGGGVSRRNEMHTSVSFFAEGVGKPRKWGLLVVGDRVGGAW